MNLVTDLLLDLAVVLLSVANVRLSRRIDRLENRRVTVRLDGSDLRWITAGRERKS